MSIIVVYGRVNTGENIYLPGESISGLSKEEEQELVSLGACRYPETVTAEESANSGKGNELPEGLIKRGGGYYELPNGDKVRGLEAATQALADLQKASNPSDPGNTGDPNNPDDPDGDNPDGDDDPADPEGPNTGLPGTDQ